MTIASRSGPRGTSAPVRTGSRARGAACCVSQPARFEARGVRRAMTA